MNISKIKIGSYVVIKPEYLHVFPDILKVIALDSRSVYSILGESYAGINYAIMPEMVKKIKKNKHNKNIDY